MGNEALTLHQVADELGVHYMTAYRYVRLGLLPAEKVGAAWQVRRSDVARLMAERAAGAPGRHLQARSRPRWTAPAPWASRLEARLRAGDEPGAWRVVEAALASGADPSGVYLEVLVPALRGIGDGWASGELDVAVEHRAAVIAMRTIGRLGPRFARRGQTRGTVVVGAAPGDLHGLPSAILADLVRGAGFSVADLGADVPVTSFVHAVREAERLVAVAVGVSTAGNEEAVRSLVASLHRVVPGVPVLVGGGALPDLGHAARLGADGGGPDAMSALALLEDITSAG